MQEIQAADITERLVGISTLYLNNFIQRELYGLRPSVRKGKAHKKRRLFSDEDVLGIALVWMLFESGLRNEAIARVLNEVAKTRKSDANLTSRKLLDAGAEYVIVIREPRKPGRGEEYPEIRVQMAKTTAETCQIVQENPTANVLLIPVGQKFADVKKRLEILY